MQELIKDENLWGESLFPRPRGPVYTDEEIEEMEYFEKIEREWRANLNKELPKNVAGWLKVFPEAVKVARKAENEKLKKYKQELREINQQQEEYYDRYIAPASFLEQEEIKAESDKIFDDKRLGVDRKVRTVMFTLSQINEMEGKGTTNTGSGVSESDIARAKEVPMESVFTNDLRKHGKLAVGKCPLHGESTGSFTIYLEQNSWWCYGCQNGGSVVDFVMQQNGVDFLTAVKQLLK